VRYQNNRLSATAENVEKDNLDRSTFGTIREAAAYAPRPPVMQGSGLLASGLEIPVSEYLARFRTSWKPFDSLRFRSELEDIRNQHGGLGTRLPQIPA